NFSRASTSMYSAMMSSEMQSSTLRFSTNSSTMREGGLFLEISAETMTFVSRTILCMLASYGFYFGIDLLQSHAGKADAFGNILTGIQSLPRQFCTDFVEQLFEGNRGLIQPKFFEVL